MNADLYEKLTRHYKLNEGENFDNFKQSLKKGDVKGMGTAVVGGAKATGNKVIELANNKLLTPTKNYIGDKIEDCKVYLMDKAGNIIMGAASIALIGGLIAENFKSEKPEDQAKNMQQDKNNLIKVADMNLKLDVETLLNKAKLFPQNQYAQQISSHLQEFTNVMPASEQDKTKINKSGGGFIDTVKNVAKVMTGGLG